MLGDNEYLKSVSLTEVQGYLVKNSYFLQFQAERNIFP